MDIPVYRDSSEAQETTNGGLANDLPAARRMPDTIFVNRATDAAQLVTSPAICLAGYEDDSIESHIVRGID
ncbi:hypothetical protein [Streptomyces sp. NPDC007205]|uniref:hypothetical protein n=1 Tax=Streptomyces sp. NPDC007205 TaxID=3154316 RepID=UPI0033CE56CA